MKTQPLTIFSSTALEFPNICARCGAETDQKLAVKVQSGKPGSRVAISIGPMGRLIRGIEELHAGSTKIPCCNACRRYLVMGRWMSAGFLLCGCLLFFFVFRFSGGWPDWLMILTGFFAATMVFGSFIPHMVGEKKSVPIIIWRESDGYYYEFHSTISRAWASRLAARQQAR
jgi:hypothetical protein